MSEMSFVFPMNAIHKQVLFAALCLACVPTRPLQDVPLTPEADREVAKARAQPAVDFRVALTPRTLTPRHPNTLTP